MNSENLVKPRLIIKQEITPLVNKYQIFAVGEDGGSEQLIGLAQQKRFAIREKVLFYTDDKRDKLAFTFRAEKIMDVHGRYLIEDPSGNLIGMLKKEFLSSLAVSTWKILDRTGIEQVVVKESNATIALLRRFGSAIPFVGSLIELAMMAVRYHFTFMNMADSSVVAEYRKIALFRDHYRLDMTDDAWARSDWRVLAAMSIGLDMLQSR